jgi:protein-L-isoaspartate(D-aspartate) O-methyltransferase
MLELLNLQPGHRVLEIGAGTGYNAALMAAVVGSQGHVTTLDSQSDVAEQARQTLAAFSERSIQVVNQDGFLGYAPNAPYDRIIVTAAAADLSPHWVTQLAPGGHILMPLQWGAWSPLLQVTPAGGERVVGQVVALAGFMPLASAHFAPALWPHIRPREFALTGVVRNPAPTHVVPGHLLDFYFFLAMLDERAVIQANPLGYGLHDPELGTALLIKEPNELWSTGRWTLALSLSDYYREWMAAGSPRLLDYYAEFVSPDTPPELGVWSLARQYYTQRLALDPFPL